MGKKLKHWQKIHFSRQKIDLFNEIVCWIFGKNVCHHLESVCAFVFVSLRLKSQAISYAVDPKTLYYFFFYCKCAEMYFNSIRVNVFVPTLATVFFSHAFTELEHNFSTTNWLLAWICCCFLRSEVAQIYICRMLCNAMSGWLAECLRLVTWITNKYGAVTWNSNRNRIKRNLTV